MAGSKFWLSKKGVLQRADEEELSKADRKAFEDYRVDLKKWMLSPEYAEFAAKQKVPQQAPRQGERWINYEFRFPCPCDTKEGRHDWQRCGESDYYDAVGDGDRCSQCGSYSLNGCGMAPYWDAPSRKTQGRKVAQAKREAAAAAEAAAAEREKAKLAEEAAAAEAAEGEDAAAEEA
eukprot:SAG31_NODE_877_length_11303_cov_18.744556_5_plen_177_part_00